MTDRRPPVRASVLRRYHEATYGGRGATGAAFEGATFDEYFSILKGVYPGITRRGAARQGIVPRFAAEADEYPPDEPPSPPGPPPRTEQIGRNPKLDLSRATIDSDVQRLIVNRIKDVSGWRVLSQLGELVELAVVLCRSTSESWSGEPVAVAKVDITECGRPVLRLVLEATRARTLMISQAEPIVDIGLVARHRELEALHVAAPLVRGLSSLEGPRLVTLGLGRVEPDRALTEMLRAQSKRLRWLSLTGSRPFGPEVLPDLPKLESLQVPGYPEEREKWIDFAVTHPAVACRFNTPDAGATSWVSVEATHRDIDILRYEKKGKVTYAVESDLAGELADEGYEGDNGELEDALRKSARALKKKVQWGSEADTLVARTSDVDTIRWIIDCALDAQGEAGPTEPPGKPRGGRARKR